MYNLHDDKNGDVDSQKPSPGQPSNLLKLADTSEYENCNCRNKHKPIGADGMVREHVKSDRCAKDSRRADNSVRDKKEDTDDLLQPRSADHVGHVGDGVAASMCIAEVALHNGAVCVECLPPEDIDRTG